MGLQKVRFNRICVNIALLTGLLTHGIVCQTGLLQLRVLDTFWHNQDVCMYDFRAQLEGTGSRSEI